MSRHSERDAQIQNLYVEGLTMRQIADRLDLSHQRIQQILAERGVVKRGGKAVRVAAEAVVAAGGAMSLSEAAAAHGITSEYVGDVIRREHPHFNYAAARDAYLAEQAHGTASSYSKRGCRCDLCRRAKTQEMAEWRRRAAEKTPPASVHGTSGGYCNWSCRCEPCKQAANPIRRTG